MIGKLENAQSKEDAFTLIELLVVILIIGILAAIAIPVFLNQRKKANISAVQSDLKNAALAMDTAYVNNKSVYPTDLPTSVITSTGVTLSLVGNASNDPKVKAGWTRVPISAPNKPSLPDSAIYVKTEGATTIFEIMGPQIAASGDFNYYFLTGCINAVPGQLMNSIVRKQDTTGQGGNLTCANGMSYPSITLLPYPLAKEYTVTKETTVYIDGPPVSKESQKDSYCIDGSHANATGQPWHYDSIAGGLAEGKCP